MACQYFVGGRWVSENEFKALLNDGLLDTLVASKKLDIKGFKVDSSKAKVADKKIIERTSVPAVKLAEILAQEIKTRQGYAPNMLSALELNDTLTDFKIPLWASPYADKFESLLTSIVSNKVVKQKLPGNSYVLGSEEGFKVKEGDDAAGNLKDSNIVFTSKFDPTKGLQPMRVDPATGKILPAQIMIPFKLRNERGEILNIEEFMTVEEDNRKMLDMSKIPDKLLQLFGFRIPTQERNSMAAVEVVGFLPEAQGDLILAPRDFTKQMGSDFDVDKLYTYMYNHFYQNGKFYINFLTDPKKIEAQIKIAKESLKELRESLNLSKEENKILKDYINNTVDSNEEGEDIDDDLASQASEIIARSLDKEFLEPGQIETLIDRLSVLNRSYTAARQNKILDIHLDVMTSNNPDVIASIIALDSFGEFDSLSKEVNKIRSERGTNPAPLTILSDIYQRTKYINATAGQDGVGAFSLDSTFNAASQGKELVYENLSSEAYQELYGTAENPRIPTAAEMLEANNPVATFGDVISKGDLSNMYTLRSQALMLKAKQEKRELTKEEKESLKFKSTIIRALQSTAVDNEKAQILDKLNINADTFSAIRAMTILGFEEQDIAGLITQDIIWEYLAATKANRSTTSKYNANFQEELMQKLYAKYDPENKLKDASPDQMLAYQKLGDMSGERLIKNLENGEFNETKSTDFNIGQLMMLEKFLKLDEIGGEIKKIQSAINTSSKGVPKSLLETNTKVTQIENLGFSKVFNAPNLLESTINGYASEYGTMFADKIYEQYFPYKTEGFQALFKEVLTHVPGGSKTAVSTTKLAEVQSDIFEDVKSYFYSNESSSLFLGNPDEERRRLFIDKEGENKSLATILQELSQESWYQKNQFLNKLSFNFNSNGDVSRVNFESSNAANFDERSIYAGFSYLLSKNVPLGNFNGIEYTTRLLAQDLITAAFLEGGVQGSKQYLRYIPIGYLKTLGFGSYLGNIDFDFLNTFGGNLDGNGYTIYSMPSNFTRQYMQNNPNLVKTVGLGDLKGKVSTLPQEFELDTKALEQNFVDIVDPATGEMTKTQTHFLTIRDNNKNSKAKYALYEFDESARKYYRIPVLEGSYGFTQYNSQNNVVVPVFAEKLKDNKPSVVAPGTTIQNIPVEPTKKFDPNVVNNPAATVKTPAGIDTTLSGVDAVDDMVNKLMVLDDVSKLSKILLDKFSGLQFPDKFKVVYTNDKNVKGNYNSDTKVLTLNLNHPNLKSNEDLALLIAHELTHVFTADTIKKFQVGDTANLSKEELDAVTELQALQMSYLNYIQQEGKQKEYEEFVEKYKKWKTTGEVIADNDSISKYYGATKLTEFVTMALTDRGFQAYLNNVKLGDQSFMAKLKSIILDLLNAMGIDIKPGTALSAVVKSSMDLIEATQAKQIAEDVFYTVEQVAAINSLKENGITIHEMDGTYDVQDNEEGIVGDYIATLDQAIELGKQILAAKNIQPKRNVDSDLPGPDTKINIYAGTGENAELSNFAFRPFKSVVAIQTTFNTVEGAFQAAKFRYSSVNMEDRLSILLELANTTGAKAKALGRTIKGLDTKAWDKNSSQIMKALLKESFEQNPDALAKLLATGDATLTHTQDKGKWGKEFPKLLMEVRDELRSSQPIQDTIQEPKYELFPGVYANAGQREAIDLLTEFLGSDKKEFLLQGKGGTGKTTIIKKILEEARKQKLGVLGVAPTHKAKKILGKSLGTVKTVTLASALAIKLDESTGNFVPDDFARSNKKFPLKGKDLIIIDESYMISDKLLEELRSLADSKTKIIFMGDRAQLPPVGQEADSKVFGVGNGYELTEKMRQAATSPIIGIGTKIAANVETTGQRKANPITQEDRVSKTDSVSGSSITWESNEDKALDEFANDIRNANGNVNYAKIVTFNNQNHNSPQSVKNLNAKVRRRLFGDQAATTQFMPGEVLTAYETYGDEDPAFFNSEDLVVERATELGPREYVITAFSAKKGERSVKITLNVTMLDLINEDGMPVPMPIPVVSAESREDFNKEVARLFKTDPQLAYKLKDRFDNLEYGYAVTSHKAQGSTYTNVYVMEDNIMGPSNAGSVKAKNQSLYVAVSRPTTKLVMISNKNGAATTRTPLDLGKLSNVEAFEEPMGAGFNDEGDSGPSLEDWELFNNLRSDDSMITRELDEDMYQKYLLICGK